jgi:hypothetical protein
MACVIVSATVGLGAQQGSLKPGLPPVAAPPVWTPPARPATRPGRLMTAQQLAWAAYPELRTRGLQVRVDETTSGPTITIGFAERDREDVLGLSRPREAQLVIEAAFDASDALTSTVLRGPLTHAAERRRVRALPGGWTETLRAEGAVYGPDQRAKLLRDLPLTELAPVLGRLRASDAAFQNGAVDEGPYWAVTGTGASGSPVTLGFEPYAGRLVRVTLGGGR